MNHHESWITCLDGLDHVWLWQRLHCGPWRSPAQVRFILFPSKNCANWREHQWCNAFLQLKAPDQIIIFWDILVGNTTGSHWTREICLKSGCRFRRHGTPGRAHVGACTSLWHKFCVVSLLMHTGRLDLCTKMWTKMRLRFSLWLAMFWSFPCVASPCLCSVRWDLQGLGVEHWLFPECVCLSSLWKSPTTLCCQRATTLLSGIKDVSTTARSMWLAGWVGPLQSQPWISWICIPSWMMRLLWQCLLGFSHNRRTHGPIAGHVVWAVLFLTPGWAGSWTRLVVLPTLWWLLMRLYWCATDFWRLLNPSWKGIVSS